MIVRPTQAGWDVIYHRAHALLAAQMAGQWRRKDAPPRLYETIAAISHHDDLEKEWEGKNLTAGGAPMDFTLDPETSVERLVRHADNALYRGRWVALLTSIHLTRLTEVKRDEVPGMAEFLDQQYQNQKKWLKELDVTKADVDEAYAFMLWCDNVSLILCKGDLPADERALEVSEGPDGTRYDIVELSNGCVTVKPWPFQDDRFTVNVEACSLSQVAFASDEELVAALQAAPRKPLEWTFVK